MRSGRAQSGAVAGPDVAGRRAALVRLGDGVLYAAAVPLGVPGLAAAQAPAPGRAPGPVPAPAAAARGLRIWGYYPWWLREHWRGRKLSFYEGLNFFHLDIADDARLPQRHGWPEEWQALRTALRAQGQALHLSVTLFEAARFERLFTDERRRARLLAALLELAPTCDGVHLDFEVFDPASAAALAGLRQFCRALRDGLRARPAPVALSAFGVMGARTELYDRATLALFDQVVVQGYDSHHADSARAGPVAPLRGPYAVTWENTLRHYLALGVDRRQLFFGLPFFGYEWPTTSDAVGAATRGKGTEVTYALKDPVRLPDIRISARERVAAHGLRRDGVSGSPYYTFRDAAGGWRQGWFEDEASLGEKLAFARREALGGVAVFPVGYDDGAFDTLLERAATAR
jgi:spore germination protein YaaH